jgi:signal transduction histidine kinase
LEDVTSCDCHALPPEASSQDIETVRAALVREANERRRAECRADMQNEVVNLALDLLVREPDIEAFFGALAKTMVEESESHSCAVWLLEEDASRAQLWMGYVKDKLYIPRKEDWDKTADPLKRVACATLADHLFAHRDGWARTIEYRIDDPVLPDEWRAFAGRMASATLIAAPMLLGTRTLGWMTVSTPAAAEPEMQWWRVAMTEAIARQAALALHHSRLIDAHRREERRKAILEERNRLARDIHDSLAQGFAAILMQLQAAQREGAGKVTPSIAATIDTAVGLARTHLTEARRSVGALRPNVGQGEDIPTALRRIADINQMTASMPIELEIEELPRLGDAVEREIIGIAQEALTNAVRHSRARRITVRASTVQAVGVRVSVADDGRGLVRDEPVSGFGMTSMQERAERIGASLTVVTGPRKGTEIVLAWEPSALPTQVHVAG